MPDYTIVRRTIIVEHIPATAVDEPTALAAVQAAAVNPSIAQTTAAVSIAKHPQTQRVATQQKWKTRIPKVNTTTAPATPPA